MSARARILERILSVKREECRILRSRCSLDRLVARAHDAPPPRAFESALRGPHRNGADRAVIGEIKRASPSRGTLQHAANPAILAEAYERGGAVALSVLTDRLFFGGSGTDLRVARAACTLPVLAKDFFIDPYQVYQARTWGADCILVIVAALDDAGIRSLRDCACAMGMACLVEVHTPRELERARSAGASLIGINNRDMHIFETDLHTMRRLAPKLPAGAFIVSESGIASRSDIDRLFEDGARAFLVGEHLMLASDVTSATAALVRGEPGARAAS